TLGAGRHRQCGRAGPPKSSDGADHGRSTKEAVMASVTKSVDVEAPISAVYNQWTQFESFPEFMSGVERITQADDTHTHWVTDVGGVKREFDTRITEQH